MTVAWALPTVPVPIVGAAGTVITVQLWDRLSGLPPVQPEGLEVVIVLVCVLLLQIAGDQAE